MTSPAVDYDTLAATTSVEEMTDNKSNQDVLRSLKNDERTALWLCAPGLADDPGDFVLRNSEELGWLGHFVKTALASKVLASMASSRTAANDPSTDFLKILAAAIILKSCFSSAPIWLNSFTGWVIS